MFTTGSKFLIGSSVVALVATVVYGIGQDGVLGTVGLASATACLVALTVLNVMLRDSNVFSDDPAPIESVSAARRAPSSSVWPLGFAFGAVVIVVGLTSYQSIVVVGLVVLLATGAEWALQAWSERASSDAATNSAVRSRLSNPLEYPIGGAVAAGIIVYSFSRVMLWLSKTNTVIVFVVVASIVVAAAFVIAVRPKITTGAIGGVVAVGAVAVVAAGAFAGLDGERSIPEYETTTVWQQEAILHPEEYAQTAADGEHPAGLICESAEAFPEADTDASQTVAGKSGTYQVFLTKTGELAFDPPGAIESGPAGMVLPRSNATNVIFRNDSDQRRRLSLDLGTQTVEVGEGDAAEEVEARSQICTTLIDPGAAQLLTVNAPQPTFAFDGMENPNGASGADGFWFFVPGVDTAKLELIIP